MSEESFAESQKGTQTREKVQSLARSPSFFFKKTLSYIKVCGLGIPAVSCTKCLRV